MKALLGLVLFGVAVLIVDGWVAGSCMLSWQFLSGERRPIREEVVNIPFGR